ncbi:hypothetical protein AURDEDRAFT_178067 [Auricularia subglabra TFB-10046 SS5]|uniref:Uncharacterized protein n=1 Tax=Auricularia subglabra (strain TFB-10046 / SS5) TaxID=717982 RepID=J0WM14_AURST|nr:hypothetical protein AURDEDRAFT_178067 [Auricularia subglabra TFB-10046 SS5]
MTAQKHDLSRNLGAIRRGQYSSQAHDSRPSGRVRCYRCGGRHLQLNCRWLKSDRTLGRCDRDAQWRRPALAAHKQRANLKTQAIELNDTGDRIPATPQYVSVDQDSPPREILGGGQKSALLEKPEETTVGQRPLPEASDKKVPISSLAQQVNNDSIDAKVVLTVDELLALDPGVRRYWYPDGVSNALKVPILAAYGIPQYQQPNSQSRSGHLQVSHVGTNQKCPADAPNEDSGWSLTFWIALCAMLGISVFS